MTTIGDGAIVDRHVATMRLRDLSPLTIKARTSTLRRLNAFLEAPVLYASRDDLLRYLTWRTDKVGPGARRNDVSHLRAFYDWCVDEALLSVSPAERLPVIRTVEYVPKPMPEPNFGRALAAARAGATGEAAEEWVIIALAGFLGLRACEIARLDWRDIRLDERELRVERGKGNRQRVTFITDPVLAALQALPHRTGPVIRPRRQHAFGGYTTPNAITKRASRFLAEQGIPQRLHSLRHRFGTMSLEGTGDLRAVAEAMGHSSMNTTAIYAKSSATAVRRAVQAAEELRAA